MFLVKIGIKESDQSNFCNNATDSILHYTKVYGYAP